MRSFYLYAGVALAALAASPPSAPAQPPAPASSSARPAASCPVPLGWSAARFDGADDPRRGPMIVNDIAVLPREELRWNSALMDRERLDLFLQMAGLMMPPPVFVLWRDGGAGCADLAATASFFAARFACTPETCRIAAAGPARRTSPPAPPAPPSPPVPLPVSKR